MYAINIANLLEQRRVLAEHIRFLNDLDVDLKSDQKSLSDSYLRGAAALAILLPVNIIMNTVAPGLKVATTSVAGLVKEVYDKVAKSGKTYSGSEKPIVDALRKITIDSLKSAKAVEFIPVVDVLVGMYFDTMALMQYEKDSQQARSSVIDARGKVIAQINKAKMYLMKVDGEITKWFETAAKLITTA